MAKWSLPIDKYVTALKGDLNAACRAVALDAFSRIIVATPVDTGRARGNWMVDLITPPAPYANPPAFGAARTEGGDSGANGAAAQAAAMARAYRIKGLVAGVTVRIRNTLPYIIPLENGWSGQAPNGMIKTTMAALGGKRTRRSFTS